MSDRPPEQVIREALEDHIPRSLYPARASAKDAIAALDALLAEKERLQKKEWLMDEREQRKANELLGLVIDLADMKAEKERREKLLKEVRIYLFEEHLGDTYEGIEEWEADGRDLRRRINAELTRATEEQVP